MHFCFKRPQKNTPLQRTCFVVPLKLSRLQDHSFNFSDKASTTHCSVPKLACPSDGVSPCLQCCCTKLPPSSPHHLHHHHHHQHHQHQHQHHQHQHHASLIYLSREKCLCLSTGFLQFSLQSGFGRSNFGGQGHKSDLDRLLLD